MRHARAMSTAYATSHNESLEDSTRLMIGSIISNVSGDLTAIHSNRLLPASSIKQKLYRMRRAERSRGAGFAPREGNRPMSATPHFPTQAMQRTPITSMIRVVVAFHEQRGRYMLLRAERFRRPYD